MTGLISGRTYNLRVESRNSIGYSPFSNVVTAMAAVVPTAPAAPTTLLDVNNVIIDWNSPSANAESAYGAPILGYQIYIRWQDGTYSQDLRNCDGSNSVIITNTMCTIPITSLMAAPYNLLTGSSVFASVVAYNAVGMSQNSDVGNGAVILVSTVPDAPLNLQRNPLVSPSKNSISFTWIEGLKNGN